jgi:hypothetical protein
MDEHSIFYDKAVQPDATILRNAFGGNLMLWDEIYSYLQNELGSVEYQWKYYDKKGGWILQIIRKQRTLCWLQPHIGCFSITFWFCDRAIALVEQTELPATIVHDLVNAKKYAIGRSIGIDVKHPDDALHIKKLLNIKVRLR